ncbi:MAG: DNA polymerase III subunit beta [Candidatus Omnitrophica bacterium]|nr:DNA polymerase III subunit beta [Candidatus Omnitrophota bacterium]
MRISTKKELLLDGIQAVIGVVTSKNTLPILSNILIESDKNKVRFTATDLDIGMTTEKETDVIEDGSITAPAKRFIDIVKELPEGKVELYTKKNHMVIIESKGIIFKILGIPKDEFPTLPNIDNKKTLSLKQPDLKKMLEMTCFAMSNDETRYVLNGVCFIVAKELIKTVATDGRRLAIVSKKNETSFKEDEKVIIPTKTIQALVHALKEKGEVKITFSQNQIMFTVDELRIVSRLIEGEFPNYEQAIPKETKNKIKVSKDRLSAAIKRASLLTTPESQAIKLQVGKDSLIVSKITPEIGETQEDVEASYGGEGFLIGFNPTYLLDVLKAIGEQELAIELSGPDKPAVIRVDEEYIYIVLPMQIT